MMRTTKRMLLAATLAVASLGAAAQAQASQNQCPDGYLCAWEDPNFSGGFFAHEPLSSIGKFGAFWVDGRFVEARRYDNGHPLDNSISSLWNRTSLTAAFWPANWWMTDQAEGCALREQPGGAQPNLALASPAGFPRGCANDVFSSLLLTDY